METGDIKKMLSSYTALNIYFWVAFMGIPYFIAIGEHKHDQPNMRALLIFALFYAAIVYINNLYLLPKFFKKKKFTMYFALIALLIFGWAVMQVNFHQLFYGCNCIITLDTDSISKATFQTGGFVAGFTAFKLLGDYQQKEADFIEKEKERLKNELQLLKGQISPHFLFNTLNSIYASALEKSDDLPDIILKLSSMLRYMLYESNDEFVPLAKELSFLKNYVELQQIRLEGQGSIQYEEKGNFIGLNIAPAILINLVENAFKYSFGQVQYTPEVVIKIKAENKRLHFTTKNTFSKDKLQAQNDTTGGIGLINLQQRLKLIYHEQASFSFYEEENYYHTSLELNLS